MAVEAAECLLNKLHGTTVATSDYFSSSEGKLRCGEETKV